MDPVSLIPLADPLPIPWAWFDVLLIVTFTAHIMFMNALLGSAAVGLVRMVRGNDRLVRDVGQKLPPLLALTINMGVAPLLFLQVNYGHFDYVSSVLMGGWWLSVIAALLFSYYGFYTFKFGYNDLSSTKRGLLFTVSLAGLFYVGFMLSNNMTLMLRPEAWTRYFSEGTSILNLNDPLLYPRFLHFMTGALAVGGLFVALLGHRQRNGEYVEYGMKWFIRATLINLGVGAWYLMSLPDAMILQFMGRNVPATATLGLAVVSGIITLLISLRKHPVPTAIWATTTIFLMSCARHWVRTFHIEPYYKMETTPVTHQYGSLYLFLGFLLVGLALVGYMLKLYFKSKRGVSEGRG